ncbi:MAG: HD domain-containing protein [Archaeoglobus sp.]|nr:HD domain-containing protein [Archaeoglobus sp.]
MDKIVYVGVTEEDVAKLDFIEVYSRQVLEYVHRGIPNFPNHGVFHVLNVIDNIKELLGSYISLGYEFSPKEWLILYLSAWLHDWGNIVITSEDERSKHAEYSVRIMEKLGDYLHFLGKDIIECVKSVILYHSSVFDLAELPTESLGVRLRLISAFFRIADACDASFSRASQILFKILDEFLSEENREFWEAHQAILDLRFSNTKIIIEVEHGKKEKAEKLIKKINQEVEDVNKVLKEYEMPVLSVEVKETPPLGQES